MRRTTRLLVTLLLVLAGLPAALLSGAALATPVAGFEQSEVTSISGGPTEIAWTPDGRTLFTTKHGQVRVRTAAGTLLSQRALDLGPSTGGLNIMCTDGERALGGIAVHPQFATNRYIYLYYTYNKYGTCVEQDSTTYDPTAGPVNRLSRFVLGDNNIIDPKSETVLLDTAALYKNHHNGGDVQFGKDGMLYVTIGDGGTARFEFPQKLDTLFGKVIRLTDTGGIPADNPYTGVGTARCNSNGVVPAASPSGTRCQEVNNYGLRNPFRFAFDPNASGTRYFINDVGQHSWEEINESAPAANYGWPVREGPCDKDMTSGCTPTPEGMTDPIHAYVHVPPYGGAATGGAFVPNGVWPAEYDGSYLFADYVFGWIYTLTPDGSGGYTRTEFADVPAVVSMRFGPDGAMYVVTRDSGRVVKITSTGSANRSPVARLTATPTTGATPLAVQFDGRTSSDPDGDALTYAWDFTDDGVIDATTAATSHTYTTAGRFTARLVVTDGRGAANSAAVTIEAGNEAPVATITAPAATALGSVGQAFTLTGSAVDPEAGQLPDSSLSWEVLRHHATHTHPFLDATSGNNLRIVYPEPEDFDAASTSYLEIRLTATDAGGLTHTVTQNLMPKKVPITLETAPSGLTLGVSGPTPGGTTVTTPSTVESWDNYAITVNAPAQQDDSGNNWVFDTWSDGGAAKHTIVTPSSPATYTATFKAGDVPATTETFTAVADARVREASPTSNYATSNVATDGGPAGSIVRSYVRFQPSSVSGAVSRAVLRLHATSTSSTGYSVRTTAGGWSESGLTWNNAPAPSGTVTATSGPITSGAYAEVDVTGLVVGSGEVNVAITSTDQTQRTYASREAGAATAPQLVVTFGGGGGGGDTSAPTAPVLTSATAAGSTSASLTWSASTDAVGVVGYTVYRDGVAVAQVSGSTTSYTDAGLAAGGSYRYEVDAVDAATNRSPTSNALTVTTPPDAEQELIETFTAVADARVREASPTSNYATSNVATDGGPAGSIVRSYVRFQPSSVSGAVSRAVLRLHATSTSSTGYSVRTTAGGWSESGLTWNNAPAPSGTVTATSGPITSGAYAEVDVTGLVVGSGEVNVAITSTDQTQRTYASREAGAATAPQLVVTFGGGGGGGGGDTSAPTAPVLTSATAAGSTSASLTWSASTDAVGVVGYTVYRDGVAVAQVSGSTTSYTDAGLAAGGSYRYEVDAVDAATNRSPTSNALTVTTPSASALLFADDFEGGSMSRWTTVENVGVTSEYAASGSRAARAATDGSVRAYASHTLPSGLRELYFRTKFQIVQQGDQTLRLLRLQSATGSSLFGMTVGSTGRLGTTNYVSSTSSSDSGTVVGKGAWHEVQVRVVINGNFSQVEVWYDGVRNAVLSKTEALGTGAVGRTVIGDTSTGRSYDVVYDDVAVSREFVG